MTGAGTGRVGLLITGIRGAKSRPSSATSSHSVGASQAGGDIETGRREAQRSEGRVGEDDRTRTEAGAADEESPTMTPLARRFLGGVHWRRRVPAPDCQTEPPRGAAMRR
jgi:hypothetical protein